MQKRKRRVQSNKEVNEKEKTYTHTKGIRFLSRKRKREI
jgi:hypothetical protein